MSRKTFTLVVVLLTVLAFATPALAYVVEIATSIPAASAVDDDQLKQALGAAVDDILQNAIGFTPTVVTIRNVRRVADRIYLLLLIADAAGEEALRQFLDGDRDGL